MTCQTMSQRPTIANSYTYVALAILAVLGWVTSLSLAQETDKSPSDFITAENAQAQLEQGNQRCVEGKSAHGHDQEQWREKFLTKQKPFATVLGCSDSRVAPELLFDQGFGELFVIRVAGNIVDEDVVGSIQYAVEHLDNKLIVVLGHQNCGAVTAALSPQSQTQGEPEELDRLLNRIRPAIKDLPRDQDKKQLVAAAVEANALASAQQLRQVPSIARAIKEKEVKVVAAVYHIDSGKIKFLDENIERR